jgi:hypothetical protein
VTHTESKVSGATLHGRRPGFIQINRFGSPVCYSTRFEPTLGLPVSVVGEDDSKDAIEEDDPDTDERYGLLPGDSDYNGLGKRLVESPLETIRAEFEKHNLVTVVTHSLILETVVIYSVKCHVHVTSKPVFANCNGRTEVCK